MRILLQKHLDGTEWLECHRADGTVLHEEVQVGSAYHDIAHFVVERRLGITEGIWGQIAAGYSLAEYNLPNEDREFAISPEGYRAEFLATLVQSAVGTGGISPDYLNMLRTASAANAIPFPDLPDHALLQEMVEECGRLTKEWAAVPLGGELEFDF